MRVRIFLAAPLFLAACVSTDTTMNDEAELRAYAKCNHDQSVRFAVQPGDPYSLAIAAEAACPREKLALLNLYGEKRGPGPALDLIRSLERTAVRSNTGTIARVRSGA